MTPTIYPGERISFSDAVPPLQPAPAPEDTYLTVSVVTTFIAHNRNAVGNEFIPMLYGKATVFHNNQRVAAQVIGEVTVPETGAQGYVAGERLLFHDVPMADRHFAFSIGVKRVQNASLMKEAFRLFQGLSEAVSKAVPGLGAAMVLANPLLDQVENSLGLIEQIADFGRHNFEVYTNDALTAEPAPNEAYRAYIASPGPHLNLAGQSFRFNTTSNRLEMLENERYGTYIGSSYMVIYFRKSSTSAAYTPLLIEGKTQLTTLMQQPEVQAAMTNTTLLRAMLGGVVNGVLLSASGRLSPGGLKTLEKELNDYALKLLTPISVQAPTSTALGPEAGEAGIPAGDVLKVAALQAMPGAHLKPREVGAGQRDTLDFLNLDDQRTQGEEELAQEGNEQPSADQLLVGSVIADRALHQADWNDLSNYAAKLLKLEELPAPPLTITNLAPAP